MINTHEAAITRSVDNRMGSGNMTLHESSKGYDIAIALFYQSF